MESELVCERQVWWRRQEGWMKDAPDDCSFHDAGLDWSDRDWPEVSVLRGGRKFWDWSNGG